MARKSVRSQIMTVVMAISLTSVLMLSVLGGLVGIRTVEDISRQSLVALRESKKLQIEDMIKTLNEQVHFLSTDPNVRDAIQAFASGYEQVSADNGHSFERLRDHYQYIYEGSEEEYFPTSFKTKLLQDRYIANNPNKINEFNTLVSGGVRDAYDLAHIRYHPRFNEFLKRFDLYDILLIEPKEGRVVYSVSKEVDFATSLENGPYKNSGLARAYHTAKNYPVHDMLHIEDFSSYPPSRNKPAAFITEPIMRDGQLIGVLAVEIPVSRFDDVLTGFQKWREIGMGETGEVYLVGPDGYMRSNSRLLMESPEGFIAHEREMGLNKDSLGKILDRGSTIGLLKVDTRSVHEGMKGNTGTDIRLGYVGHEVISAYAPIDIAELKWVIVADIFLEEALAPVWSYVWNIGVVVFLTAMAVLVGSSYLSERLTDPIERLLESVRAFRKGDLDQRVPPLKAREMWELGEAFNETAVSIQDLLADNKEQVRIAEEASRMKSTFLANMSHELRTPLNAILGITEMLLEDVDDDAEDEFLGESLDRVNRAGRHLLGIINDVLDISKIEAGKVALLYEKIDLPAMLKDLELTALALAEENNNELRFENRSTRKAIRSDIVRLRQVLINLLGNACKFTSDGVVKFVVEDIKVNGQNAIQFEIIDTGIGMAEEHVEKLFKDFQQADSSTTKKYGGTGLGLAISKRLTELMGGDITVTSVLNDGSTFTVTVPLGVSEVG